MELRLIFLVKVLQPAKTSLWRASHRSVNFGKYFEMSRDQIRVEPNPQAGSALVDSRRHRQFLLPERDMGLQHVRPLGF